jgi:hypothetical protein
MIEVKNIAYRKHLINHVTNAVIDLNGTAS